MFGIIKWIFILALLGAGWFSYDFYVNLNQKERSTLKEDTKELLDSGKFGSFADSLGEKLSDDFNTRFWPKIKRAFKVLSDEDQKKDKN